MSLDPHLFVILGATGDLTSRKLLPALYQLIAEEGLDRCVVLGTGGTDLDDAAFRTLALEALQEARPQDDEVTKWCSECVHYERIGREDDYTALAERIAAIEAGAGLPGNRVLYLALPPSAFGTSIDRLGNAGLHQSTGWTRLVIEKPFGTGLESARELNAVVHGWFDEDQIYRIDHYLGKETVQNLLTFRFANSVFESVWNRDRIDRIEITVAEELGVEGRAGYYEQTGALRDMVQNHLTQVLTLVAMEAPNAFNPTAVRNEKVKVLFSVSPISPDDVVLGQYVAGVVAGSPIPAYADESDVPDDSLIPTYAALRVGIDNWRWQGVPFYLRTGKALSERTTQIAVRFRQPPVSFFEAFGDTKADELIITLQPGEGFELHIDVKKPGQRMALDRIALGFEYEDRFGTIPKAYETLLQDIIEGDQTLFVRADEVERSWALYQPLLDAPAKPYTYPAGTWGPVEAEALLPDGATWTTS